MCKETMDLISVHQNKQYG